MALTPKQIAELLKLRALGWSQAEIAEQVRNSHSKSLAINSKNSKNNLKKKVQMKYSMQHLIGGLAGAAAGIGIVALLELLKDSQK